MNNNTCLSTDQGTSSEKSFKEQIMKRLEEKVQETCEYFLRNFYFYLNNNNFLFVPLSKLFICMDIFPKIIN